MTGRKCASRYADEASSWSRVGKKTELAGDKIYVGSFFIGGGFVQRYPDAFCCRNIGTVTTDANGNFDGAITTSPGAEFVFPAGTSLAQPSFVFTYIPVGGSEPVVYTTGFAVVAR